QKPGLSISAALTDSFVGTRLPFDIPFYLTVTTTATAVVRISLNLYEVARRTSASALVSELQDSRNCQSGNRQSRPVSTARRSATNTFSLLIDDLEPQRYYVLCFVSRGPVDPKTIDTDVRKIIRDTAGALVVS